MMSEGATSHVPPLTEASMGDASRTFDVSFELDHTNISEYSDTSADESTQRALSPILSQHDQYGRSVRLRMEPEQVLSQHDHYGRSVGLRTEPDEFGRDSSLRIPQVASAPDGDESDSDNGPIGNEPRSQAGTSTSHSDESLSDESADVGAVRRKLLNPNIQADEKRAYNVAYLLVYF